MTDLATDPTTEPQIDDDLLEEAKRQLSTPFRNAAINEALRRLVEEERRKRRAARARLQQMYDDGEFDFTQLDAAEE